MDAAEHQAGIGASRRWPFLLACSTSTARLSGCTDGAVISPTAGAWQGQRPLSKGVRASMDHDLIIWLTKDLIS